MKNNWYAISLLLAQPNAMFVLFNRNDRTVKVITKVTASVCIILQSFDFNKIS